MSPNGRRAWRKAAKKLRRKLGRRWRSQKEWLHGKRWSELVPDLEAHREHIKGGWFRRHGFTELDPRYKIRQYIGLWGTADGDGVEFAVKSRSFTARSLVGMTMGERKRAWDMMGYLRSDLHIGERLRPCPGCPQCTDDPLRIVRALSRRMKLRLEIRRCNSAIIPSKFDYLAMLHRPGPAWGPVCGFGPMRQDAVRALCDVILRDGAEEFPIVLCDGSGVMPARKSK